MIRVLNKMWDTSTNGSLSLFFPNFLKIIIENLLRAIYFVIFLKL